MTDIKNSSPDGEQQPEPELLSDPFDLEAFRDEGDDDGVGAERILTTVRVDKPPKRKFFRTHPGDDYTLDVRAYVYEDGVDKKTYLVVPALREELYDVTTRLRLVTYITKRDVVGIWPLRIPDSDGAGASWHNSALEAAEIAKTRWVRIEAKRDLSAYEIIAARGALAEPKWPDKTFRDLMRIGFKDRVIEKLDHPVIRELNGEL